MMVGITWDLALATQMLAQVMTSELLWICVIPPVCHRCSHYHSINVLSFDFHTWFKLIQQFAVLCLCMLAISCTSFHLSGFILFVRLFVYEVTASGCRFRTTPCIELLASLLAMGVPPGSQQSDKSFQRSVKPHRIIECRRASQQSTSRSWILQKRWWSMHGPQLVKPNFHCMIYVYGMMVWVKKRKTWCRNLQLSIFYLRCEISDQVLLPHPVLSELLPAIAAHALTLAVEPCEGGGCYNHQNVVGFVWLSESAMVRFRLKIHGRFHWSSGSLQQGASDSLVWLEESRFAYAKRQVLAALALTASGIATVGHSRVAPARCSMDTTQTYTDPLFDSTYCSFRHSLTSQKTQWQLFNISAGCLWIFTSHHYTQSLSNPLWIKDTAIAVLCSAFPRVGAVAPFDHSNKEDRDLELLERSYSRLSLWRKKRSVFAPVLAGSIGRCVMHLPPTARRRDWRKRGLPDFGWKPSRTEFFSGSKISAKSESLWNA